MPEPFQFLVINDVLDIILNEETGVICIIPEAWKFIPERVSTPVKEKIIHLIRQGAARHNFIWIDSQDMANISKEVLKQVSVWILGYQSEINEVNHTIMQIPGGTKSGIKPEDIMKLKQGQFFVVADQTVKKTYVLPKWMDEDEGRAKALNME